MLKLYGTNVISPVIREELRETRPARQLRKLRRWLVREDLELDPSQRQAVEDVLATNQSLSRVVEFKEQLKALMQPSIEEGTRLARLREWCANAEATHIEALREFATRLRGYSLNTA